jgi:hypothetical protein
VEAQVVLDIFLKRFPDSFFFLWFAGRLARMQCKLGQAGEMLSRLQQGQQE